MFANAIDTLLVLYAVDRLDLNSGQFGLLLSTGAVGALVGASVSAPLVRGLGLGPAYLGTTVLACGALLLVPSRPEPGPAAVALVATGLALAGFGVGSSRVYAVTLRQTIIPEELLGRVLAAYRLISYGSIPLAGVVAGVLGSAIGVRGP